MKYENSQNFELVASGSGSRLYLTGQTLNSLLDYFDNHEAWDAETDDEAERNQMLTHWVQSHWNQFDAHTLDVLRQTGASSLARFMASERN